MAATKHYSIYINLTHLACVVGTVYLLNRKMDIEAYRAGMPRKTIIERISEEIDKIKAAKAQKKDDNYTTYTEYV